jgi:uncharacterized lipoprotein YddW (UPF0748 family)
LTYRNSARAFALTRSLAVNESASSASTDVAQARGEEVEKVGDSYTADRDKVMNAKREMLANHGASD